MGEPRLRGADSATAGRLGAGVGEHHLGESLRMAIEEELQLVGPRRTAGRLAPRSVRYPAAMVPP